MITKELLQQIFPSTPSAKRNRFIDAFNEFLPKYSIDSYRRVSAFLACVGIESDYIRAVAEYASGSAYENRRDLGNFLAGDGKRYKGRGIIQTTGRFNYWRVVVRFIKKLTGKDWSHPLAYSNFAAYLKSANYERLLREASRLGVNFLDHPEKLEEIDFAVEAACIFWQENNLNNYADAKEFKKLNGIVNRGDALKTPLHWAKRNELYSKCVRYIPNDFKFEPEREPLQTPALVTSVPISSASSFPPETVSPGFHFDLKKAASHYGAATATLQQPAIKTVLKKAGVKLFGGLTTVWATTGGRIAVILTLLVGLGVAGSIIYSYRANIALGYQVVKANLFKFLQEKKADGND